MRLISRILVVFGVAFLVVATVYGLISQEYGGVAFLAGTGLASLFVAVVIRVSPVLEFMRATPESGIERQGPERPVGAGGTGPERPVGAGGTGPERSVGAGGTGPERPVGAGGTGPETEPSGVALPGPSAAPIFLALGAAVVGAGIAFDADLWIFLTVGGVILLGALVGWAVQAWNESAPPGADAAEAPAERDVPVESAAD